MAETKVCPFFGIAASGTSTIVCVGSACKFWSESTTIMGVHTSGTALTECLVRVGFARLASFYTVIEGEDVG